MNLWKIRRNSKCRIRPSDSDSASLIMKDQCDLPFHELIAESDRDVIQEMRMTVCSKYQRSRRLNHFSECLSVLASFVEVEGETGWKRALLCGFCMCGDIFAVNNTRLQAFTSRCKSSLNDLFARMGYKTVAISQRNRSLIIAKIPFLALHPDELRQWTYRIRSTDTPISSFPEELCCSSSEPPTPTLPHSNIWQSIPSETFTWDEWSSCPDDFDSNF
jgi:hypothetical protein